MSATSPSSALGRCVVCGKESLKGCSKCKAAGLDWMYFCSVDHQALIWKVHKRVCGENPFRFPFLNGDEAKELQSLQREAHPGPKSEGKTWSEVILDDLSPGNSSNGASGRSRTSEDLDKKFQRVVLAAQSPCLLDPTFHNTFIAYLRSSIFSVKSHRIPPLSDSLVSFEDTRQLLLVDPFGYLARLLAMYIDGLDCPEIPENGWRSEFQHRLLILIARLQAEVKSEPYNPGRYSLSEERMNELKPLMRACNLIPTSKPTETNLEIFNQLMSDVFEFAGYELEFELFQCLCRFHPLFLFTPRPAETGVYWYSFLTELGTCLGVINCRMSLLDCPQSFDQTSSRILVKSLQLPLLRAARF